MKKNLLKYIISIFVIFTILFISACTNNLNESQENKNINTNLNDKKIIVTTFFPIEEITKEIVKDLFEVKVLVPINSEPHSYEPTARDIQELSNSDVFIIMGGIFATIEDKIIYSNKNLKIINSTNDNMFENLIENNSDNIDPHIWLSIDNMIEMTKKIELDLSLIYPEQEDFFKKNSANYIKKLEELNYEFKENLSDCKKNKILTSHKAFGYISRKYGFEQITLTGFSPEIEPTPNTIINLIQTARNNNLSYIYSEIQLDSKVINTIANDVNLKILKLNAVKSEMNQTYISIQKENLRNLIIGLECN